MAKVVDGNFGKYPTGLKHTDVLTRPLTLLTGFSRGKTRSLTLPGVTYTVCCHKRRPLQDLLHISIVRESLIYFGGSLSVCSPCAKH